MDFAVEMLLSMATLMSLSFVRMIWNVTVWMPLTSLATTLG